MTTRPLKNLMLVLAIALVAAACAGADDLARPGSIDTTAPGSAPHPVAPSDDTIDPLADGDDRFIVAAPEESLLDAPSTTLAGERLGYDATRYSSGGTATVNDEPYDLTFYDNYGVNPRIDTLDDPLSTFAVDVDTGSYTIARRYLADGFVPDKDSVRVEEYVNYFDQRYPAPDDEVFAIFMDGGPTPFTENDRYQMLRIGIQGYEVPETERKPANLTFVVDVSGSMDREDRLGTVQRTLELLVGRLRPSDQVGLVVYGTEARVVLDPTAVEDEGRVLDAIWSLSAEGSTNAEEGLILGYELARRAYTPGAINRVILASDGVANVGATGPDSILQRIESESSDIQLVTVGFGMGNYNDVLMERLADNGDGFYAYVDTLNEAERIFVEGLTGTLQTIAEDAKIQVEFNPAVVERYRLVGFENRAVADDQFRDDTVDAGEIGAGHSVTALYEVRLAEGARAGDGAATVFLRWRDPDDGGVREMSREMVAGDFATSFDRTSQTFQLATTVAAFAEVLRESYWAEGLDMATVARFADRLAEGALGEDDDVREFARLVGRAVSLAD